MHLDHDAGSAAGHRDHVHPNDHANRSQSTNDTYPTAMALAVYQASQPALSQLEALASTLRAKAAEYGDLDRLGRTCLQDAAPLTIRDTHLAQAAALERTRSGLATALDVLSDVPLGATAVGTGIGAPPGYAALAVQRLAERTGRDLTVAANPFDALAHLDPYAGVAAATARAAITAAKIAADLRLLSLGAPRRHREGHPPRPPARLLDHAGQGQPGHPRARDAAQLPHPRRRTPSRWPSPPASWSSTS